MKTNYRCYGKCNDKTQCEKCRYVERKISKLDTYTKQEIKIIELLIKNIVKCHSQTSSSQ